MHNNLRQRTLETQLKCPLLRECPLLRGCPLLRKCPFIGEFFTKNSLYATQRSHYRNTNTDYHNHSTRPHVRTYYTCSTAQHNIGHWLVRLAGRQGPGGTRQRHTHFTGILHNVISTKLSKTEIRNYRKHSYLSETVVA